MKCKQCGNEFEAKRSTARYCGDKCRKLAFLGEDSKVSVPPCTPDQLTSSCCACKDNETCDYLHNMNSAVPGDAEYAGVI